MLVTALEPTPAGVRVTGIPAPLEGPEPDPDTRVILEFEGDCPEGFEVGEIVEVNLSFHLTSETPPLN